MRLLRQHKMTRREDESLAALGDDVAGYEVAPGDGFDGVAPELHAKEFLLLRQEDVHAVAAYAELAAFGRDVVAFVLDGDEHVQEKVAVEFVSGGEAQAHGVVVLGRGQAVDAGDAGDDERVAAFEQGRGGAEAEALDVVVDAGVLRDVGVGLGDVGFGQIVVVVADEVSSSFASVKVLPLPVTPSSVWWRMPRSRFSFRRRMASAWSPAGS